MLAVHFDDFEDRSWFAERLGVIAQGRQDGALLLEGPFRVFPGFDEQRRMRGWDRAGDIGILQQNEQIDHEFIHHDDVGPFPLEERDRLQFSERRQIVGVDNDIPVRDGLLAVPSREHRVFGDRVQGGDIKFQGAVVLPVGLFERYHPGAFQGGGLAHQAVHAHYQDR